MIAYEVAAQPSVLHGQTDKRMTEFFKYREQPFSSVNLAQVSISPTFYEQLLRQNPFAKKLQTQIVSA